MEHILEEKAKKHRNGKKAVFELRFVWYAYILMKKLLGKITMLVNQISHYLSNFFGVNDPKMALAKNFCSKPPLICHTKHSQPQGRELA